MYSLNSLVYSAYSIFTNENSYLLELKKYLKSSKDKTEVNFLKELKVVLEKEIKERLNEKELINKISDEHYIKRFCNNEILSYVNEENKKKWVKKLKYCHLPRLEVKGLEESVKIVEIKLNRLPGGFVDYGNKNPYPDIFRDFESFLIFENYATKHNLTPYKDFSFLYQQLNSEKRLLNIMHIPFAEFLLNSGYINQVDFEKISNLKGFDSKSSSNSRLNNYYLIVDEVKGNKQ